MVRRNPPQFVVTGRFEALPEVVVTRRSSS
jgi:hypothetical protein